MINLNKKLITKELLYQHVSEVDVFEMYIKEPFNMSKPMSSPLREDPKPSFGYFFGENNEICFKDFVLGSGDCIKFVMMKFGLNYFEALSKIAIDANIEDYFILKNTFKTNIFADPKGANRQLIIKELNTFKLGKKSRNWALYDLAFWNSFGISKSTLDKYNIEPISHIFIKEKIIVADKYAYCFSEKKDGNVTYKIYQPFNTDYKWLNNHNESVWQGWEQMPLGGDILIITKSLKDVMAINDVCNIPSVSLQAESVNPKPHIIDDLKKRFKTVFILYDNDYDKENNWGREFGLKIAENHNLIQLEINEDLKSKDFSDLVKNHGRAIAKEYLENNLKEVPF